VVALTTYETPSGATRVVAGLRNGLIRVWAAESLTEPIFSIHAHPTRVVSLRVYQPPYGHARLVSCDAGGCLKVRRDV
jgi:WD40 repeat protein